MSTIPEYLLENQEVIDLAIRIFENGEKMGSADMAILGGPSYSQGQIAEEIRNSTPVGKDFLEGIVRGSYIGMSQSEQEAAKTDPQVYIDHVARDVERQDERIRTDYS